MNTFIETIIFIFSFHAFQVHALFEVMSWISTSSLVFVRFLRFISICNITKFASCEISIWGVLSLNDKFIRNNCEYIFRILLSSYALYFLLRSNKDEIIITLLLKSNSFPFPGIQILNLCSDWNSHVRLRRRAATVPSIIQIFKYERVFIPLIWRRIIIVIKIRGIAVNKLSFTNHKLFMIYFE